MSTGTWLLIISCTTGAYGQTACDVSRVSLVRARAARA